MTEMNEINKESTQTSQTKPQKTLRQTIKNGFYRFKRDPIYGLAETTNLFKLQDDLAHYEGYNPLEGFKWGMNEPFVESPENLEKKARIEKTVDWYTDSVKQDPISKLKDIAFAAQCRHLAMMKENNLEIRQ